MKLHLLCTSVFLLVASCTACDLFPGIGAQGKLTSDIVFTLPSGIDPNYEPVIESDIAYITEMLSNSVCAYDLNELRLLWRCRDIALNGYSVENRPLITSNYIYVVFIGQGPTPHLAQIGKRTGALTSRISWDGAGEIQSNNMVLLDNYIYFLDIAGGLARLSLNHIEGQTGDSMFTNAEYVYTFPGISKKIGMYLFEYGGDIVFPYFTYEGTDSEEGSLVRIDRNTGAVKWKIDNIVFAKGGTPLIRDGLVYLTGLDVGTSRVHSYVINLDSGDIVKRYDDTLGYFASFTGNEDNVFLITPSTLRDKGIQIYSENSIYCFSHSQRKILWAKPIDNTVRGISAQAANGILYVPTSDSLELYDENTGKFLGRDETVWGDGWNMGASVKYKDMILITQPGGLIGVRMNWKKNAWGRLEKI